MKPLSPTRTLCILPGAPYRCAWSPNRSLLPASSTTVFAILFRRSQFPRARCHVSCPAAQSRHGLIPLLPTIDLHSARAHRNHGRPRPNGFTGRAQRSPPPLRSPFACTSGSDTEPMYLTKVYDGVRLGHCPLGKIPVSSVHVIGGKNGSHARVKYFPCARPYRYIWC